MGISQNVNGITLQNLSHIVFYVKMKIALDFHICISVLLKEEHFSSFFGLCFHFKEKAC